MPSEEARSRDHVRYLHRLLDQSDDEFELNQRVWMERMFFGVCNRAPSSPSIIHRAFPQSGKELAATPRLVRIVRHQYNRRMFCALSRIALTLVRLSPPGSTLHQEDGCP